MFPAAQTGEILRIVETDLQWELTLDCVDKAGIGQTNLHLQIILGFVPQSVVRMFSPSPTLGILYWVGGVGRLQVYKHWAGLQSEDQNRQRQLET